MTDNNISKNCVTHSSYIAFLNSLYYNMKNDNQTPNLIISLLLKFKQTIISKDEKKLIPDNLSKRVYNYKHLFTNMKIII